MSDEQARSEADKQALREARADRIDDLKARLKQAQERNDDLKDKWKFVSNARVALQEEYDAVRRSYHLAGVGKKIDISTLADFSPLAKQVMDEGRAGMHFDRLYTLWQTALAAPQGLPIVEVGSYKGGSSKFIAETLRQAGQSPRFYVCDTFQGHARIDPVIDGVQSDEGFRDTSAESVREYLAGYPNIEIVVGDIVETSAQLKEPQYGFVHIDVDVYPPTAFCLSYFAPRLAPGAMIVVDDYGVVTCPGAQKAVDDFVRETPSFARLHLLSGQAVLFRAA
jgi:predicted O-methyltransferase YrrM